MTREVEIEQQTFVYYETCSDEDIAKSTGFIQGAKWADQHPREGLWDSEKVINFLKERATLENSSNINIHMNSACYHFVNDFIQDLRKAMED